MLALTLVLPLAAATHGDAEKPEALPGLRRAEETRNLTPMHREIRDALDLEGTRLQELNARLQSVRPGPEFLELQREVEAVKKAGQITVFEIQLRHARAEGRVEDADQLAEAIHILHEPPSLLSRRAAGTERPAKPPRPAVISPN
jgi:hypothetical protein